MQLPAIGFIGVGKVAQTLGYLWHVAGYPIVAVYNRDVEKAKKLAHETGAKVTETPNDVVRYAQIVFLTVSDDAIFPLSESLSSQDWHNVGVVHTSGVHSLEVLDPLARAGAWVASLHPAFPFADVETARSALSGTSFAMECDSALLGEWLSRLVSALGGHVLPLPRGQKALYHASLVIASNYTVTLYSVAQSLLRTLGADSATASLALNRLVEVTTHNLLTQGTPNALTGPLTRADIGTIEAHLHALPDSVRPLYRALARYTYPMLEARHVPIEGIEALLRKDEEDASNPS